MGVNICGKEVKIQNEKKYMEGSIKNLGHGKSLFIMGCVI